jgi:hypothetical protein
MRNLRDGWIYGVIVSGVVLVSACSHPSDRRLQAVFYKHQQDLSALLDMAKQDRPQTIWIDSHQMYPPQATLPDARWREYERLCRPLGVWRVSFVQGQLELIVSSEGILGHGSSKGFVYSETPLTPVLPLLDQGIPPSFIHEPEGVGIAYRSLTLNWYIFYLGED